MERALQTNPHDRTPQTHVHVLNQVKFTCLGGSAVTNSRPAAAACRTGRLSRRATSNPRPTTNPSSKRITSPNCPPSTTANRSAIFHIAALIFSASDSASSTLFTTARCCKTSLGSRSLGGVSTCHRSSSNSSQFAEFVRFISKRRFYCL
jgi:hypothetical protein